MYCVILQNNLQVFKNKNYDNNMTFMCSLVALGTKTPLCSH